MQITELLEALDASTMDVVKNTLGKREFAGAALLSSKMVATLEDTDVVFFCPCSYFNLLGDELRGERAFFLLLDEPLKPISGRCFITTIKENDDYLGAFESVAREFRTLQKKKERILEMTRLVNRNASLQTLLNVAGEVIGAPGSVVDNSFSYLAVTDNFPEYVAHGQEKTLRSVPADAFGLLKDEGLVNPRRPFDYTVFDWTDEAGNTYTNHFAPIYASGVNVGSVSFMTQGGRRLRPSRLNMLPSISQILGLQMQRSNAFVLNKTLFYAHLFKVLREGKTEVEGERVREQFSLFGYELKRYLQVFVVDFSLCSFTIAEIEPLAERLAGHIENAVYTISQTEIVYLSSTDEPHDEGACDFVGLELELGDDNIHVGVSESFENPREFPAHEYEAKRATFAAKQMGDASRVHVHQTYLVDDILLSIEDPELRFRCLYPPMMRLLAEDEKNPGDLMRTLRCYIEDPSHPAEVAKRLFIHKNTLYFRLDKIRQIMGCDLHDGETIAKIVLTFHLLRMQKRLDLEGGEG